MNKLCRKFVLEAFHGGSLLFLAFVLTASAYSTQAAPIFSQTITNPDEFDGATGSDRDTFSTFGLQAADDFTLPSPATARSVTWWGVFGPFNNTPVTPVSFDLIFYADQDGRPDLDNVISSTPVSITSLTDTGDDLNGNDIYEFQANLTPTALPGGTKTWFSVLANTSNDPDDSFLWRFDDGGTYARRRTDEDFFTLYTTSTLLFVLDDAALSEPSLTITSFKSLGSGFFEMSLNGESSTAYNLRYSSTLDFSPGTLVTNLTQGQPGDPGTISGIDSSIVSTDGSGIAKVQMVLPGPMNFVRALSAE